MPVMQRLSGTKIQGIWEAGRNKGEVTQAGELIKLFPWESESARKKAIGSLPPKARIGRKVRSMPKTAGQEHLEVYLKNMEKARMALLGRTFGRLLRETAENWEAADKQMRETEKKLDAARRPGLQGEGQ